MVMIQKFKKDVKQNTAAELIALFDNVAISNVNCIETENGFDITAYMCADFELVIEKENVYGESAGYEPKECSLKIEYK